MYQISHDLDWPASRRIHELSPFEALELCTLKEMLRTCSWFVHFDEGLLREDVLVVALGFVVLEAPVRADFERLLGCELDDKPACDDEIRLFAELEVPEYLRLRLTEGAFATLYAVLMAHGAASIARIAPRFATWRAAGAALRRADMVWH